MNREDELVARLIEPLPVACVIEPGAMPSQINYAIKSRSEWLLIDQGIQPRRTLTLEVETPMP